MRLRDLGEVPEPYRALYAGRAAEPDAFPYSVLTPSFEGFRGRQRPSVLCLLEAEVRVAERRGDALQVTRFAPDDVNYVQVGNALLRSWLTISGVAQGTRTSFSCQYSAVSQVHLEPFIAKLRAVPPSASADLGAEREKLSSLLHEHFKFMNLARRSILPGERVLATVVQQPIRGALWKNLARLVTPAHLGLLTDRELILIAEPRERLAPRGAPYGGIWHYVPLNRIRDASLVPEDEHLVLQIELPGGDRLRAVFGAENRAGAEAFVRGLRERIGKDGQRT